LADIRPEDIEAFRAQRKLRNGGVASVSTINADHAIVKHVLSVAERRGLLGSNAAKKVPIPDPNNERDRVLTEEEWTKLYAASAPHLKPILLLAHRLGPRKGEILKLEWPQVDLKRGIIKFRSIDTKTKEPRIVPLTPDVHATLAELAKVRRLDTNRVFLYDGKPIQNIKRAFRSAVRRAGLDDLRCHDLRHCAATNLRRAGVDTVTAMKIVGHKSERMHRRYNKVEETDLKAAATRLNAYLSNTVITPAISLQETPPVSA
jgi:integrase